MVSRGGHVKSLNYILVLPNQQPLEDDEGYEIYAVEVKGKEHG